MHAIDLTLMIDVLEHIPDPILALKEVERISKFAIFKVSLEINLYYKIWNIITKGKSRRTRIESWGHINEYNLVRLENQIEKYTGKILNFNYTNIFEYFLPIEKTARSRLINSIGFCMNKVSAKLCSIVFCDHVIILVKCFNS